MRFLYIATALAVASVRKISSVTVLLPTPSGRRRVQYKLEAFGGNYSWTSTNPTLVEVVWWDETEAIISPAEGVEGEAKAIILAHDRGSRQELRCEVYISRITRVEVMTTWRTISVDDVETLSVRAFDAHNNVFSSLEGLYFLWQIKDITVLRQVALRETEYKLSPLRRQLEEELKSTDVILVRGESTGQTEIMVRHGDIASQYEVLTVSEHLVLVPSFCYTLPQAEIQYALKVMKGQESLGNIPPLELPVQYFEFEGRNIDIDSKLALALTLPTPSKGEVVVKDGRIVDNSATATTIVAEPYLMKMAVRHTLQSERIPFNMFDIMELDALYGGTSNWNFVQGNMYWLFLEVEDGNAHSLSLPRNLETNFFCTPDPCLLEVHTSPQQWALPFIAQTIGQGVIGFEHLRLPAEGRDLVSFDMETSITFTVNARLQLPTDVLVLAPEHSYEIVATGGSSHYNYLWRSSNESVAVVGPDGLVVGLSLGITNITVLDLANTENQDVLLLYVREWSRNTFGEELTTVSSKGVHGFPVYAVPVMSSNENLPYFCNATAYAPSMAASNPPWVASLELLVGPHGCAEVRLTPESCGELTLTAGQASQQVVIYDPLWLRFEYTWPLRHPPLKLDHAEFNGFALALDATVEGHLVDGPRGTNLQWTLHHNSDIVRVVTLKARSFSVTCLQEGSMKLVAQIFSDGGLVEAEAEQYFLCGIPTQVRIFAIDHFGRLPVCELKQLSAVTNQNHKFALIAYDENGVPLAEPSDDILWFSSMRKMEQARISDLFVSEDYYEQDFYVRGVLRHLSDSVNITGAHQFVVLWPSKPHTHFLVGYDYAFCIQEGSSWDLRWSLTGANFTRTTSDALRHEDEANCRGNWALLGTHSTRHFSLMLDDDGLLGSETFDVTGTVCPLGRIRHPISQSHQEVGLVYDIPLLIYDNEDHLIHYDIWRHADVECNERGERSKRGGKNEKAPSLWTEVGSAVKVVGNKIGAFDLRTGIRASDLWSNKVEIVVFPLFALTPDVLVALPDRNLTAEFQINGGTGDAVIKYRTSDSSIADVSALGRVTFHKPGVTTITADLTTSVGIIATDTATVVVAVPASVEISAPPYLISSQSYYLGAHLFTASGQRFTPALLAFPEDDKPFCDFAWRSDEGFAFTPDGPDSHGLVGKGLNVAMGRAVREAASINVEIRCDGLDPMRANAHLKIKKRAASAGVVGVPLQSKIALETFGVDPKAQVTLSKRSATLPLMEYLEVGTEEAEWLLVAKLEDCQSTILALAARALEEVRFMPAPSLLPLGSSVEVSIQFLAEGNEMAFPSSGIPVFIYSSHSSILKVTHFHNKVRIHALKPGCAGIQVEAQHDRTQFGVLRLCTALDSLVPHAPVVALGAEVYFFLEKASLGTKQFRIQLVDTTEQQIRDSFPKEMGMLIDLPPSAVSIQTISMASKQQARVTFEVDPSSDRSLSSEEWSTQRVVQRMWYHSSRLGPFLRTHWDRQVGVFPISVSRASSLCTTWSSSDNSVVTFPNSQEGQAVAVGVGIATVTYCGDFEQTSIISVVGVQSVRGPESLELTNFGSGDIVIPLKLIEETGNELAASSFVSQRLNVVCTMDQQMQHFFEISTQMLLPDQPFACILRRLPSPVSRLLSRGVLVPSGDIVVEIAMNGGSYAAQTLTFPFWPAFVLLDNSGRELDLSSPIILSKSRPMCTFRVWTGGGPPPTFKGSPDLKILVEHPTDTLLSIQVLHDGSSNEAPSLLIEGKRGQVAKVPLQVLGSATPTQFATAIDPIEDYIPIWIMILVLLCSLAYYFGTKKGDETSRPTTLEATPFRRLVRPDRY